MPQAGHQYLEKKNIHPIKLYTNNKWKNLNNKNIFFFDNIYYVDKILHDIGYQVQKNMSDCKMEG